MKAFVKVFVAGSAMMGRPDNTRQEALRTIAASLSALATRLRTQAAASEDFARLTERARGIAASAWEMRTSRWGFTENAGRLADALLAFAQEAAAASARARSETDCNLAIVDVLAAQTARIAGLGKDVDAGQHAVRSALEPLEETLVTMQAGVAMEASVTADAAALARQAAALAGHAMSLRGGGRQAGEAAAAIAKAMNTFIDDANLIACRMTAATTGFSDAVERLASGARDVNRSYVDRVTRVVWS